MPSLEVQSRDRNRVSIKWSSLKPRAGSLPSEAYDLCLIPRQKPSLRSSNSVYSVIYLKDASNTGTLITASLVRINHILFPCLLPRPCVRLSRSAQTSMWKLFMFSSLSLIPGSVSESGNHRQVLLVYIDSMGHCPLLWCFGTLRSILLESAGAREILEQWFVYRRMSKDHIRL